MKSKPSTESCSVYGIADSMNWGIAFVMLGLESLEDSGPVGKSVKSSKLDKRERRLLNKILQDKRNCRWYIPDKAGGEFCFHPKHNRNLGGFLTWGLCKGVCNDFETKEKTNN